MFGRIIIDINGLSRDNVAVLAEKREIASLPTMYMRSNEISNEGAKTIAEALKNSKTLQHIVLRDNQIGNEWATAIADALKKNTSLQKLSIGRNGIGDQGAKAIAEALKENASLRELYIEHNSIGDQGAKVIAEALKENTSLQKLFFGGNSIGVEGAKAIADALKHNKTLKHIDLGYNKIGVDGAKAIVDALKENHSLQKLDIAYNNIGDEGCKDILSALKQIERSAIESIVVWGNQISKETLAKIHKEMTRIQKRFESFGSNEGQVVANTTAAGGSQGVQNERSSSKEDEGVPTIHATNASQGSAENFQETNNEAGNTTTAMETEVEDLKSTIAELQGKIAEQDKELASMTAILKTIGNLTNGRHGGTISSDSMPDRETELHTETEIERYKQEIDSLKEQLKNSKSIEAADSTNEVETAKISEDESEGEEASSKRQRTESAHRNDNGPRRTRNSTRQVQVKQENIMEGAIKCPDPDCGSIVLLSERGCNRVVCTNHTPHFLYFCAHCKTPGEPYSETLGCDCPKRNTPADRERAQEMRNNRARENPEVLE